MSQTDCISVPLDLPGLAVIAQETAADGSITLTVRYTRMHSRCPCCHQRSAKLHDERAQICRDVPLGDHPVRLRLLRRRFRCPRCLVKTRTGRWRPRVWSEPHGVFGHGPRGHTRRTTARLRQRVGQAALGQTIKHVARDWHVGERFVRGCWCERVQETRRPPPDAVGTPRWLGIDDFARRKGHVYDTLICDLEHHTVLDCVAGRNGTQLRAWCERLPDPWHVDAVVIDMSATFRAVVELCLPRAMIVADHFHVVRRVGKSLTQVCTRLFRAREKAGQRVPPPVRRAVGRDPTSWTEEERTQITQLFADLPDLARAWELKEAFRQWYQTSDRTEAERQLRLWEAQVRASGLREFHRLITGEQAMLVAWREEVLNFFPLRLTNGFVEGKNTRTKAFIRQAYGFRNRHNLRLRILQDAA